MKRAPVPVATIYKESDSCAPEHDVCLATVRPFRFDVHRKTKTRRAKAPSQFEFRPRCRTSNRLHRAPHTQRRRPWGTCAD